MSDRILRATGSLKRARRDLVVGGLVLVAALSSIPILFVQDATSGRPLAPAPPSSSPKLTIGPMWATPMDIAPATSRGPPAG